MTQHANESFTKLVSQANREALKPFIAAAVADEVRVLGQRISRAQIAALADVTTRLRAVEELLMEKCNLTIKELEGKILQIEDRALGLTEKQVAEAGDTLRVTIRGKKVGDGADSVYGPEQKARIKALGNMADGVFKEVHEGLMGAKTGEIREIEVKSTLEVENQETKEKTNQEQVHKFEIRIDRISAAPKASSPETTRATEAETQESPQV